MNQLWTLFMSSKRPPQTSREWLSISPSLSPSTSRETRICGSPSVLSKTSSINPPHSCTSCQTSNSPWDSGTTPYMRKKRLKSRECPSMRPHHQMISKYLPINTKRYIRSTWNQCCHLRNSQKCFRGSNRSMKNTYRKVRNWVMLLKNDLLLTIGNSSSQMMN